jgi:RNA polymerase sigma factor (TIGR02999 family)
VTSSGKTPPLTEWLREWQRSGDDRLDARLLEALYMELRRVAAQRLARESQAVLTPTELVHETWLRLKPPHAPIADRNSFLRLASVAMRHLLVDQARERLSQKRHGVMQTMTVSLAENGVQQRTLDDTQLLDLDRALDALASGHPRVAEAVVLRAFAGLDLHELAGALSISLATAKRDLAFGRAWLADTLRDPA